MKTSWQTNAWIIPRQKRYTISPLSNQQRCTISPSARAFIRTIITGPTANRLSETEWRAKLYRVREIHDSFFQPDYVSHKMKKKVIKKQRTMLTDKERRQWARDHWFLHHGQKETSALTTPTVCKETLTDLIFPSFWPKHWQTCSSRRSNMVCDYPSLTAPVKMISQTQGLLSVQTRILSPGGPLNRQGRISQTRIQVTIGPPLHTSQVTRQ